MSKHLILTRVVSIQCYHDFSSFCPHRPTRARLRAWVCLITIAIAHARHANAGEAAGVDGNLCCDNCSTAPSFPVLQWVLQCGSRHCILLRQLCLPLRGVWALTSSELPWAVPDGRPNLIHCAIGDSA